MKKIFLLASLLLSINSFAQVPSYVPSNGLKGWWSFTGNANDESGNGNNGTVQTGTTLSSDRFSNLNSSYYVDGIDCVVPRGVLLPATINNAGDYSVSIWFYTTDSTKQNQTIFNSFPHNYVSASFNYIAPNTTVVFLGNGAWDSNLASNYPTNNLLKWHHLVVVKTTTDFKYFQDGILVNTISIQPSFNSGSFTNINAGAITINGSFDCYESFNGKVDDVGLWNRALSQSEVTTLFNSCTACPIPTNISATNISGSQATITWTGNSCAVKYRIRYRVQGTTSWTLAIVNAPTTTKTLTQLLNNATYEYQVRSDCSSDGSFASAYSSIHTFSANCIIVTSTTNTTICQNQLPFNWNGNAYLSAGTFSVTLVSAAGCDSIATLNLTVNPNVTSTTNTTICQNLLPYTWNAHVYQAAGTYAVILVSAQGCDSVATLNLTVNPNVISTTNITIYQNQLPYSWNGNSYAASGTYSVILTSVNYGCDSIATLNLFVSPDCGICETPTNISVSNITGTKATVSWIGNSCAVKYRVRYRVQGTTAWTTKIVTAPIVSKILTGLLQLTTYEYQVRSDCNNDGTIASTYSSIQTYTTICDCLKPTNIAVSNVTQTGAKVSWLGNNCALKYRLQYRMQGTSVWTTKTINAPTLLYNITGLTNNTIYEYHLRSDCNSTGTINSGWTTTATITTPLRLEETEIGSTIFYVSPNPCNNCFVNGIENENDLIITDIVGRIINASFNKSANGFYINIPDGSSGIFIIRNISTGEVMKFVKE